ASPRMVLLDEPSMGLAPLPGAPREVVRLLAMGAVAGGLAHDFNNLLLAVLGFSGLAKAVLRAGGDTQRLLSYLDEIEIAGQRAQLLVRQLSALARAGAPRLDPGACAAVADEVVAAFATFAEVVTLSVEIDDDLPAFAIDRSHLLRVWGNLCRNACEAIDGGGTVLLSARRSVAGEAAVCAACGSGFSGDFVRLAVSDDGHGIPAAIRERVFEPFFSSGSRRSGLGLGLTAVDALVHLYGGHLQIVDRPAGGTEIAAFVPLASEEVAAAGEQR
ncbi:MAG TPA: ATP-binding protein, partial [Candidatus Accumulibacter phosphatis]|nr:ATP-binding protein [Candidatus Accumulibacter phosphatis]